MDTPWDVSILSSICVYKFGNRGLVPIGIPRSKTQKNVILQRSKLLCPETAELFVACPCFRAALLGVRNCRHVSRADMSCTVIGIVIMDRAVSYNCGSFYKSLVMNLGVKYLKTTACYLDGPLPCLVPGFMF